MARHTAKSHKIRKVEILVIQMEIYIAGEKIVVDKWETALLMTSIHQ